MKKVVSPCFCKVYTRSRNGATARAFCEIQFENGRLSITGVIGPMPSGNCRGGAGQCVDAIREGRPCDEWTQEMLDKFCSIWDEWHLNDMRPYCQHQRALGWRKIASRMVTLYHYTLTREAYLRIERMKKSVWNDAVNLGAAYLSDEQMQFARLPYSITLPHEISGDAALYYEPQKSLYPGMTGATETKTLGWLYPDEHPDGILGKPCPVCGYQYGHAWQTEEVPQEVIDWLFKLPASPVEPAWV